MCAQYAEWVVCGMLLCDVSICVVCICMCMVGNVYACGVCVCVMQYVCVVCGLVIRWEVAAGYLGTGS